MRGLVIGPDRKHDAVGFNQIYPLLAYKREIRKNLGVSLQYQKLTQLNEINSILKKIRLFDLVFVRIGWKEDEVAVEKIFIELRNKFKGKIIFIDPFDQTSSRFFGVLPFVDLFIKYQALKDKSKYLEKYRGGNYATNRLYLESKIDVGSWYVGSQVAKGQESKIIGGWYPVDFSIVSQFRPTLMQRLVKKSTAQIVKDVDVFCHVSCGARDSQEWYGIHRAKSVQLLSELPKKYFTSVSADYAGEPRISRKEYLDYMYRSKIIVSPLGWGEVTMRAFEAALSGAVLVQPEVSHLETFPNIFMEDETYMPVSWDFSNLKDKVGLCLDNYSDKIKLAEAAKEKLIDYYQNGGILLHIESIISRLEGGS